MRTLLFTLALLGSLCCAVCADDDPAARLPENALLYAELRSLEHLLQQVVDLPVWRDKQAVAAARKELLGMLAKQLAKELKLEWKDVEQIAGQARKLVFCLTDVHLRSEMPVFTAVLDFTGTEQVKQLVTGPLARLFKTTATIEGQTVHVAQLDREAQLFLHLSATRATATLDRRSMQSFLRGGSGRSLAGLKEFQELRERYGKRLLFAFGNIDRAFDLLSDSLSRRDRMQFDKVDAVFDFHGLKYVGLGSDPETDLTGQATEATVVIDPAHPIYKVARTPKLDPELLGWVPARDTMFLFALHAGDTARLWSEIVKIGKQVEQAVGDDDFSKGLDEFKNRAGIDVGELVSHFEPNLIMTAPMIAGRIGRGPAFVTRAKDRASFDKLVASLKKSPLFARMAEHFKQGEHRGAKLEWIDRNGRGGPGYAVLERTVILAADHQALKGYVDAQLDKQSVVQHYGLTGKLGAYHKLLLLDPLRMAETESDFSFLRQFAKEGIPLLAGTIEEPARLRLASNLSPFSVAAGLGLAAWRWEATREVAGQCQSNLRKVGQALTAHVKAHKKYPASLAELKLPEGTLVCPLDRNKEARQSYKYVPIQLQNSARYYGLVAWCPHTEHGRVMLNASGIHSTYAYRTSETRFLSSKARMEEALERARQEQKQKQK